jgi:tRNA (guanine-N7-)-methyltransferase
VNETPPPIRYGPMAPRAPEGTIDLDALLPFEGPLELDVGFGRGRSVFERAAVAPESRIVGIEIKSKWAYKAEEKRQRRGLERVRIFTGDAREILPRCGPEGTVTRAFVHFPDPWWKTRHAERFVVAQPFLEAMAFLLCEGGELYVQTDVEDRARRYRDLIAAHPAFALATESGFVDENPFGARSNREVRAEEDGLPVFRVLARRLAY